MFKNLREKIADSNNFKNKLSNKNDESTDNESLNDQSKNSGNPNRSRFSSISSMVSDVSSAFTKPMTAPQHIQPLNHNLKLFNDNESISEYDDSISAGDTLTKEELFLKYRRAQTYAKRYKTRYLEVVENYRKIEIDNTKLSQILSDAQDKQFRRINELKEQIELDKKAKLDVEENYTLMLEEKVELVNVLKLQVNLLKEGKDLPPELENQIKEKHERQVILEKKQHDEIKDLKTTLSQRDNLLLRCKDKINSLNSQLNELKMKCSNIKDASISNDEFSNFISDDLVEINSQKMFDIETIENEHNERINNILFEFEGKKSQFEAEMEVKFNERSVLFQLEEQQSKEKIKYLTLENERLIEQVDIKIKIINDLLENNCADSKNDDNISALKKLNLCKSIIKKYPHDIHPIINDLTKVLDSFEMTYTVDLRNDVHSDEFTQQILLNNNQEISQITDLEEQNKFLLSRIEQLEKMKLFGEEDSQNKEKELMESNLIIEEERKNHSEKCKSLENKINTLHIELNQCTSINENNLLKLSELQSVLAKNEENKQSSSLEKQFILQNSNLIEEELNNLKLEHSNLKQELQRMSTEFYEMDTRLLTINKECEIHQNNYTEKKEECNLLNDKIDELMALIDELNNEKYTLLLQVKEVQVSVSNKEEQLSLNIVEMQQRFDQEVSELKDQLNTTNLLNEDKSTTILKLEQIITDLNNAIENLKIGLDVNRSLSTHLEDVAKNNEELIKEKEILSQFVITITSESDSLKLDKEHLLRDNDLIKSENEGLLENIVKNEKELKVLQEEISNIKKINQQFIEDINDVSKEKELLIINHSDSVIKLETMSYEMDIIQNENKNLLNNIKNNNEDLIKMTNEINILKTETEHLLEKIDNISKEKEELIFNYNEISNRLEKEVQEKSEINHSTESAIRELNEIQIKNQLLLSEKELLNEQWKISANENEYLKSQLSDKEELITQHSVLKKEKIAILEEFETYKKQMISIQEDSNVDKDILIRLNEEIAELTLMKSDLENRVSEFEKRSSLFHEEKQHFNKILSETVNLEMKAKEEICQEKNEIVNNLEIKITNYETIIKENNNTIKSIQLLLDERNDQINNEIEMKNNSFNKIQLLELYLDKFCLWIEEIVSLENCNGECENEREISIIPIHCDSIMTIECENSDRLIKTGQLIDTLLLITHKLHSRLHSYRTSVMKSDETRIDNQKILDTVNEVISEIYKETILLNNNNNVKEDIFLKLSGIRQTLTTISHQLEEKNNLLSQIESQSFLLNEKLSTENISIITLVQSTSPLYELEKTINNLISNYKHDLSVKDELSKKFQNEVVVMEGKVEQSNGLFVQFIKQIINIFHLTDINVSQVSDINKQNRKNLIKGLKSFAKQHDQHNKELHDTKLQLDDTENELKKAVTLNSNIQSELDDLRTSVANDRDRLIATGEELENSMRRLNEVADEKGRIDEEKQSLRKELKELNEKISNLKLEFEKQSLEKQRLEMQFDESLEKVKSNHSALEEIYKSELEKQHGKQLNLEEQIAIHKQSSSFKLSESERKLEEVLNQSEQLLELNHQYKKLLDETKLENDKVFNEFSILEKDNLKIRSELDQISFNNKELNQTIIHLQSLQNELIIERNRLKDDLEIHQLENKTSLENMKLLQNKNDNEKEELNLINNELKDLKTINEQLNKKIRDLEIIHEDMVKKEQLILDNSNDLSVYKKECENKLINLHEKLEQSEIECHSLNSTKNEIQNQHNNLKSAYEQLKSQNNEYKTILNTYKNQINDINLEMEQMKTSFDIDKDDLEERFSEERLNMDDDFNRKLKKLAKEFSDKMSDKEREFQKTFEEALTSIRKDESRIKTDLKFTIDDLNKSTIELETERNQLLDLISEHELKIKNLKHELNNKEMNSQSNKAEIEKLVYKIEKLENEKEAKQLAKISKMNQTVDSSTYYEEPYLNNVTIKDHEVLLMHCSDIEEQVKQLQVENNHLKKCTIVNSGDTYSIDSVQEIITPATKSKQLTNQPSISSDNSKTAMSYHGALFASPNMSCSEYMFCPIPITEATDYEYLHDVLLKYMTGLETEILAKVVCTVMKFSNEETNRVLLFEQDRYKFIRRII